MLLAGEKHLKLVCFKLPMKEGVIAATASKEKNDCACTFART